MSYKMPVPPSSIDKSTHAYLYQLVEALNVALEGVDTAAQSTVETTAKQSSAQTKTLENMDSLKSLIVSTANTVSSNYEVLTGDIGTINTRADSGEFDAAVLRIDSSKGTVFKNSEISTVLTVTVYHGKDVITDLDTLHAVFGSGAYLQWSWKRMSDAHFGTIVSSDSRITNGGFTFTVSPADVDTKCVFMCTLNV